MNGANDHGGEAPRLGVERVAALAMLKLDAREAARARREFERLVAFADELGEEDAPPLFAEPGGEGAPAPAYRADEPGECLPVRDVLGGAAVTRGRYILAPRAFE